MEGELYPLSQDIHSICLDNTSNSSFKVNEEIETNSLKNNETVKVEYMTYSNYNELPPNSSTINKEIDNLNIFSSENNYIKVAKGSLITNYNRQNDAGNSRRRQTFKCPYCPKVFCNSSAIAKHKLTHSDERKYVCDICGKAFKRQDHLNGHKHTHKVNKPHACHFCDRSYSDARSLKRHYENQHQKQYKEKMVARDSGSLVDDNGPSVIEAFGYFDEHKTVKCEVCGRGFKNQAALNGHMRLHGGYGQTKNSIAGPGEPKINIPFIENSTDKNSESTANVKKLTSLPRAHSNIIIVTRPETNTDRQVQAVRALLPSSVNSTSNFSSHCNSSSVIVLNSQHFTNSPKYDQSLSPTASIVMESSNLPNVSMEDLCLVLPQTAVHDRIHDPCNINSTADKSSPPIEMSTDGITYSQSNTKQSLTNTDLHKNHYSPITPAYTNKNGNMNMNLSEQNLFTYPSLVDNTQISGQSYNDSNLSFDNQSSDDYLMNFPAAFVTSSSNSVNKSWSFYELQSVETSDYNSNPPSLKKISSSNNLQDLLMNLDNLSDSNDITNNSVHSTNEDQSWSQFPDENSSINISNGNFGKQIKKEEEIILSNMESINCPPLNLNEHSDNNLSRKPLISEAQPQASHRKIKCRPAPIFIPPQTSAHMSRLRSPRVWNTSESSEQKIPPYTPPPMLSPQRRGSGLFNTLWQSSVKNSVNSACSFHSWNTPFSAKTITAVSNSYQPDSVASSLGDHQISTVLIDDYSNANIHYKFEKTNEPEHFIYQDDYIEPKPMSVDDKDGLPTSATPRINIGPEYQAHVSPFYLSKKTRSYKRGYDTLLWNPRHFKETTENISSLNLLMKIASSPAVKSCGLNMEYTFHLLFKYQGDLEKTLQTLLEESFVVYDYVYAETSNWTTEEIGKFQERLKAHDRDFMRVALDLQSYGMNKSVKACVEFYYVWKHMNNVKYVNAYRVKQRRKLITRNNTPQQEEDNYPPVIDSHFSTFSSTEGPYNLRKSRVSENQRPLKPFSYYGYKTSSGSSSREPSPTYQKLPKTISGLTQDNSVKKSRSSYQCSQCTRVFAKLKTLENHNRNHVHSKISRNKTQNRTVERAPESSRY